MPGWEAVPPWASSETPEAALPWRWPLGGPDVLSKCRPQSRGGSCTRSPLWSSWSLGAFIFREGQGGGLWMLRLRGWAGACSALPSPGWGQLGPSWAACLHGEAWGRGAGLGRLTPGKFQV